MSRTKKYCVVAGFIVVLVAGAAVAIDKRPDSPGPGASNKELVEAARRAYEFQRARWPVDPSAVNIDEIYVWSKRWMTAEWDLSLQVDGRGKGVKAHADRMIDLENFIAKANQAGVASRADLAAANYYRIEAELMLKRTGE